MSRSSKPREVGRSGLWTSTEEHPKPTVPFKSKPQKGIHDFSVVVPGGPHRTDATVFNGPPCLGIGTINLLSNGQPVGVGSGFLCQGDVFLTARHVLTDVNYDNGYVWLAFDSKHNPHAPTLSIAAFAMHQTLDLVVLVLSTQHPGAFNLGGPVGPGSHVGIGGYGYAYPDTGARMSVGDGTVTATAGTSITYLIDTDQSDSGAPVFLAGSQTAVAVHRRGQQPDERGNEGVLLTPQTVADINGMIAKARSHLGG